jgi:Tfp pilus assembly protein PilF
MHVTCTSLLSTEASPESNREIMFTQGNDSNDMQQDKAEVVQKMHSEGMKVESIARCFGWDVSAVKAIIRKNFLDPKSLVRELEKLLSQSAKHRCAYSRRLMHAPVEAADRKIYEKRVLEEWLRSNRTGPASGLPITSPPSEILTKKRQKVKDFSVKALEVLEFCLRESVQRETSVNFAAECLTVLSVTSDFALFVGILSVSTQDEQVVVLNSFKEHRPSLLRNLLRSLAVLKEQTQLTLLLTDLLETRELASRREDAKQFIRSCRRIWVKEAQGQLTALMTLVLAKLFLKIDERAFAEDCLDEVPFCPLPEKGTSEFHGSLGDLYFDLEQSNLAEEHYSKCIRASKDPQSLTRIQFRLESFHQAAGSSSLQTNDSPFADLASAYNFIADFCRSSNEPEPCLEDGFAKVTSVFCSSSNEPERSLADGFAKVASVLLKISSLKHADLAEAFYNLAVSFDLRRNLGFAEEFHLKSLLIREEVLPSNSLDLAFSYDSLGNIYQDKRNYWLSNGYYLKCLNIRLEVLPSTHSDLAKIYNHIGALHEVSGFLDVAEEYYKKFTSVLESLPATPSDLADSYTNLANLYDKKKNYSLAGVFYLKGLKISEQLLAPNDPELAIIYQILGDVYVNKKNFAIAEKYYLKSMNILETAIPIHPHLATTYESLGRLNTYTGNFSQAGEYLLSCLRIREEVLSPQHPDFGSLCLSFAHLFSEENNLIHAEKCLMEALKIWEALLPQSNHNLEMTYSKLHILHYKKGDFSSAAMYLQKSLRINEAVLPPQHPVLAQCYYNLGYLYIELREFVLSEKFFLKAISIYEAQSNPYLASTYRGLGSLYFKMEDDLRAEQLFLKGLTIQEAALPTNGPELAMTYMSLGILYQQKGDLIRSEKLFLKALSIQEGVLPSGHPERLEIYRCLGQLYADRRDRVRSAAYFKKAGLR